MYDDGKVIDETEMNEWLDDTSSLISFANGGGPLGDVLEIGPGTGMILLT